MENTPTLAIPIRCSSCNAGFTPARTGRWRQRSLPREGKDPAMAYLCDKCTSRFSTEEAVFDYLDGILESTG